VTMSTGDDLDAATATPSLRRSRASSPALSAIVRAVVSSDSWGTAPA